MFVLTNGRFLKSKAKSLILSSDMTGKTKPKPPTRGRTTQRTVVEQKVTEKVPENTKKNDNEIDGHQTPSNRETESSQVQNSGKKDKDQPSEKTGTTSNQTDPKNGKDTELNEEVSEDEGKRRSRSTSRGKSRSNLTENSKRGPSIKFNPEIDKINPDEGNSVTIGVADQTGGEGQKRKGSRSRLKGRRASSRSSISTIDSSSSSSSESSDSDSDRDYRRRRKRKAKKELSRHETQRYYKMKRRNNTSLDLDLDQERVHTEVVQKDVNIPMLRIIQILNRDWRRPFRKE